MRWYYRFTTYLPISWSSQNLADKVVKCYRCNWKWCLIQLLELRSAPFMKLAMPVSPHAAPSVYTTWFNPRITALFRILRKVGEFRSATQHVFGIYLPVSACFSGSTSSREVRRRISSWIDTENQGSKETGRNDVIIRVSALLDTWIQ